jgi:hypothetical protein
MIKKFLQMEENEKLKSNITKIKYIHLFLAV